MNINDVIANVMENVEERKHTIELVRSGKASITMDGVVVPAVDVIEREELLIKKLLEVAKYAMDALISYE